jgi:hypothetical protein
MSTGAFSGGDAGIAARGTAGGDAGAGALALGGELRNGTKSGGEGADGLSGSDAARGSGGGGCGAAAGGITCSQEALTCMSRSIANGSGENAEGRS